jgi:transcriptional regulator with XRE-family HTH domain
MRSPPDVATPAASRRAIPKRARAPVAPATADPPPEPKEDGATPDDLAPPAPIEEDIADVTRLSGRVRFARTLAKLSKAELARRVGVCLSAAVQWELPNGTSPTVGNLVKIATISGVAFEWLATGRGSPKLAGAMQVSALADDLEFEIRLLVAVRAIARERRDVIVDFARSIAKR